MTASTQNTNKTTVKTLLRPRFLHLRILPSSLLAAVVYSYPLHISLAAEELSAGENELWQLCAPQQLVAKPDTGDLPSDATRVSAERAHRDKYKVLVLEGDVRVEKGEQSLQAEYARYDEKKEQLVAEGNVLYRTEEIQLRGARAEMDMAANRGQFEQLDYLYPRLHASGKAKRLVQKDANHADLEQLSFSTCDRNNRVWHINAESLEMNQETRQGVARNLSLNIQDIPVLPIPYLRFPIGEGRMSGLLFPDVGYDPVSGNLDIGIPYYWNIAPNYDATITPHLLSRRGMMMENEWRYLTRRSNGTLEFEYLPGDLLTGSDRGLLAYQHQTRTANGWVHNAQLNYVSEQQYYSDLGTRLDLSREPYLNNQLDSQYNGRKWRFIGKLQAFQTLSGNEQYQRMPQLSISRKPVGNNRLNTIFNSEYNYFYAGGKQYIGSRLTTQLGVSYPYVTTAGFIKPRLSWHSSQYQIEDTLASSTSQPSRDLPIFSLDSGLFFERPLFANSVIQTLEPRLYYLNVPYVDQSALPVFDSGNYTFNYNQLFRENRFSGGDRIGDANQLSMAVASRFLSTQSGDELFSVSLGQVFYLADRQVMLDSSPAETAGTSDYIAELKAAIGHNWSWKSDLLWQPNTGEAKNFSSRLQYKSDRDHLANLIFKTESDGTTTSLSQLDLNGIWQLNPRWHLFGRYNYDLYNQTELEQLLGFGYDSCCWAFRLVQRNYRAKPGAQLEQRLDFDFIFKGLSGFGGDRINEYLKNGILGYEPKPIR